MLLTFHIILMDKLREDVIYYYNGTQHLIMRVTIFFQVKEDPTRGLKDIVTGRLKHYVISIMI